MMLSVFGFSMVATFMTAIMTKRLSALVALVLIPIAFAILAGFGGSLGPMMLQGIKDLAPTGVMLLFAILYFGVMIDAGLFDPIVTAILKVVGADPVRILVGTAVLALTVSLDGDGTTTYMITVAAMLPLYRRLKLDLRKMACVIMMAGGVMNLLPWGGPTARAASALSMDPSALFLPLLPALIACAGWTLLVAWYFGRSEKRRLAAIGAPPPEDESLAEDLIEDNSTRSEAALRPRLFWVNAGLTLGLMALLVSGIYPLPVLFVVAFAIALMINYPSLQEQKTRIAAHAGNALSVVGLIFAAGIFTGILSGTKMVDAMAQAVLAGIPPSMGPYLAPITALLSIPFTFLISNDAFYFGMLPVLAEAGTHYGIAPELIGRASLVGQQVHLLSPLVPSTYLLVGLLKLEMGEHQRTTMPWALGACGVMLLTCLIFGIFPLAV